MKLDGLTPEQKIEARKQRRLDRGWKKYWNEVGKLFKEQVDKIEERDVTEEEIAKFCDKQTAPDGCIICKWKTYEIIKATPLFSDDDIKGLEFKIEVKNYERKRIVTR